MLAAHVEAACADHEAAAALPRFVHEGVASRAFPPAAVAGALLKPFGTAPSPPPPMWAYCRHACDLLRHVLHAASLQQHQMALRLSLFLIHLRPGSSVLDATSREEGERRKRTRYEPQAAIAPMREAAARLLLHLLDEKRRATDAAACISGYDALQENIVAARFASRAAMIAAQALTTGARAEPAVPFVREPLPLPVAAAIGTLNERRAVLSALLCGSATQPPPPRGDTIHWAAICLASAAHGAGNLVSFTLAGHPLPAAGAALLPSADLRVGAAWGSMLRYVLRLLQVWAPCHAIIATCDIFSRLNAASSSLGRQLLLEAMALRIQEICSRTPSVSMPPSRKSASELELCDEAEKEDFRAITELSAPFWQEWIALCDHAMALVVNRFLDIVALVQLLRSQNVKHNLVSYLYVQLYKVFEGKGLNYNDLTHAKVDAPAATVSTDTAERERTLYLRDGAASCIYWRLNREASAMPEAAGIEVALRESYSWWNTLRDPSRPANSTASSIVAIFGSSHAIRRTCLLSHMTSQPFAEILVEAVVVGRQHQPLPMALLMHLSLQSRLRVVTSLEDMLLQQQIPLPMLRAQDGGPVESYPPTHVLLETYARLLMTAPGTLVRKQIINRLLDRDPPVAFKEKFSIHALQTTLLELCTYRLSWIFKRNHMQREIVDVASELLFTTSSMQVYLAASTLIQHVASFSSSGSCLQTLGTSLHYKAREKPAAAPQPVSVPIAYQTCLPSTLSAVQRMRAHYPRSCVNGELIEQVSRTVEAAARATSEFAKKGLWPPFSQTGALTAEAISNICQNLSTAANLPELVAFLSAANDSDNTFGSLFQRYRQNPNLACGFLCGIFVAATRVLNLLDRKRDRAVLLLRSGAPIWPPQVQTSNVRQLVFFALHPTGNPSFWMTNDTATTADGRQPVPRARRLQLLSDMIWCGPVGERYVSLEDVTAALLDLLPFSPHAALQGLEFLLLRSPPMQKQLRAFTRAFEGFGTLHGGENVDANPPSMTELRRAVYTSAVGRACSDGTDDAERFWCFDDRLAERMKRLSSDAPDPAQGLGGGKAPWMYSCLPLRMLAWLDVLFHRLLAIISGPAPSVVVKAESDAATAPDGVKQEAKPPHSGSGNSTESPEFDASVRYEALLLLHVLLRRYRPLYAFHDAKFTLVQSLLAGLPPLPASPPPMTRLLLLSLLSCSEVTELMCCTDCFGLYAEALLKEEPASVAADQQQSSACADGVIPETVFSAPGEADLQAAVQDAIKLWRGAARDPRAFAQGHKLGADASTTDDQTEEDAVAEADAFLMSMLTDGDFEADEPAEEMPADSREAAREDVLYARMLLSQVTNTLAQSGMARPVGVPEVSLELPDSTRRMLMRARIELLCSPLPPETLGDAMALAVLTCEPEPLHAGPPASHSPPALAAKQEGGEVQAMALVAGWLAAHHPANALRGAIARRVSSVLRETGAESLPAHVALDAAQPALWLLDGLWHASSAQAAAVECATLIKGGRFEVGEPLLSPQLAFSTHRVADGTALSIALAAAAPICERLRALNSADSLRLLSTLLEELRSIRARADRTPTFVWEGVGEYPLRSAKLAATALEDLQAHLQRKSNQSTASSSS